jgi:predicted nucleic acid-binding protein
LSDAGFLVDTNVISEGRRPRPDQKVVDFVNAIPRERLFVSVMTIGELRKGAEGKRRQDTAGGLALHEWIDVVERGFGRRILPVDRPIARLWGEVSSDRTRSVVDTLIAATAMVHRLTLITRNTRDIAGTGVAVVNPWT